MRKDGEIPAGIKYLRKSLTQHSLPEKLGLQDVNYQHKPLGSHLFQFPSHDMED